VIHFDLAFEMATMVFHACFFVIVQFLTPFNDDYAIALGCYIIFLALKKHQLVFSFFNFHTYVVLMSLTSLRPRVIARNTSRFLLKYTTSSHSTGKTT